MDFAPDLGIVGPAAQSVGSIVASLLLLSLMLLVHEGGHFLAAKRAGVRVEEFGFGIPPRIWSRRRGETEYSINALPIGAFVRMTGEEDPTDPRSLARAPKRWRLAILAAGPAANFLLAIVLFAAAYAAGWPTVTQTEVQVMAAVQGLPADAAGMQPGDVIVSLAGQPVKDVTDLRRLAEENAGREVPATVRRDGASVDLRITPRATWPSGEGPLGVHIGNRPTKVEPVNYPIHQAIVRGVQQTGEVVVLTFYLPVMAIKGLLPWSMLRPSGPVGIVGIASQAAVETVQSGWWFPFLSIAATLSAGLGIANLLPIPALDGGRIMFVLLEALRGRRVSPQREGLIHLVGMAFLLSLIVVMTFMDISSPVSVDWGFR